MLPGGVRLHAVLPPLADGGPHLSLRFARHRPGGVDALARLGAVTPDMAELLRGVVAARVSLVVTGGTGAGKTTVLAALVAECPADERVVVVEDVRELDPEHPHVVRLQGRGPNVEGVGGVTLVDLVRQALRMRPDRLVVGEVRGAEVRELLAALNTGHEGGMSTLHANGPAEVPARFEALGALAAMPREGVHAQLREALRVVVHVVRRGGHRIVDRVGVVVPDPGRPGAVRVVEAAGAASRPGRRARAAIASSGSCRRSPPDAGGWVVLTAAVVAGPGLPGVARPQRGWRATAPADAGQPAARGRGSSAVLGPAARWLADAPRRLGRRLRRGRRGGARRRARPARRGPRVGPVAGCAGPRTWLAPHLRASVDSGRGVTTVLEGQSGLAARQRRDLALLVAAWRLAEEVGAAASAVTASAAASVRERRAAADRTAVVVAGPRASMVLLSALPLAGPAAALLVGLPPGRLYDSTASRLLGAVGLLLTAAGGGGPAGCSGGPGGPAAPTVPRRDRGGAARGAGRARLAGSPTRWAPAAAPPEAAPPGPATVEEAAAALGLVAAALRGGVGAVEALEAVAAVDPGAAGRELAVVAAAHRWGQPPDAGLGPRRPGLGCRPGGLARRPQRRGRAGRPADGRRGPDARRGVPTGRGVGAPCRRAAGAAARRLLPPGLRRDHGRAGRPAPARRPGPVTEPLGDATRCGVRPSSTGAPPAGRSSTGSRCCSPRPVAVHRQWSGARESRSETAGEWCP